MTDLARLGTAALADGGAMPLVGLRALWPGARLAGPAVTVRCAVGDNLAVQVGAAEAPAGAVLVVDAGGDADHGYWGEVLVVQAQVRGLAGVVVAGGVRDAAATEARGFPTFSVGPAPAGCTKGGPGAVGVVVVIGGVAVAPGDLVVGDADGVVVLPSGRVADIAALASSKAAKEDAWWARLAAGETTIDLYGFDVASIERA